MKDQARFVEFVFILLTVVLFIFILTKRILKPWEMYVKTDECEKAKKKARKGLKCQDII